ncbi:hypothetical protein FYK55_07050 [Roseiconus nitratireducens]|uniref:Tetratricopeptide repeat protein n=1 Tax=Roseiconus nitratireducens TaxID=2605748 RepID=A0A5M6DCW5_9BACT|nr:hypothetical protein [Roseiconus nitratireducens]KAA5545401.1 hypothetical protein FYK55_07050 [Roseiconus nitratireducens]
MSDPVPGGQSIDDLDLQRDDLERWANRVFNLPEQRAESGDLKLLELVGSRAWFPTQRDDIALRILWGDHRVPVDSKVIETIDLEERQQVADRVSSFERNFFSLPVGQRRQRWEELMHQCGDLPLLHHRVKGLERGLDVRPGDHCPDLIAPDSIGDFFQRLFLAERDQVSRVYAEFDRHVLSIYGDQVETLAENLKQYHPKIAMLHPGLLTQLMHRRARKERESQVRGQRALEMLNRKDASVSTIRLMGVAALLLACLVINIVNGSGRKSKEVRREQPKNIDPYPGPDEMMGLYLRPGEDQWENAQRLAKENPTDSAAQYRFGRVLIKSAPMSIRIRDAFVSARARSDDERELFYLRACEVLESLAVAHPEDVRFAATFYEACQRYADHPQELKTVLDQSPDSSTVRSLTSGYFRQLADTHRRRHRFREAVKTLADYRKFSRDDPGTIGWIATRLAMIAWSADSESDRPEPEVADRAAQEFLSTLLQLWSQSHRDFGVAESDA